MSIISIERQKTTGLIFTSGNEVLKVCTLSVESSALKSGALSTSGCQKQPVSGLDVRSLGVKSINAVRPVSDINPNSTNVKLWGECF